LNLKQRDTGSGKVTLLFCPNSISKIEPHGYSVSTKEAKKCCPSVCLKENESNSALA
jgi:hypothetical protein